MKFLQLISGINILFLIQLIYGYPVKLPRSNVFVAIDKIQPEATTNIVPKQILNRSIFVVPTVRPNCSNGFTLNQNGKCEPVVQFEENNYIKFILDKIFSYDYDNSEYDYDQYQDSDSESNKTQGSAIFSIPFL